MRFTLDLDMPATVQQVEEFCAQVRRVHEASSKVEDPVDEVLIKTQGPGEDDEPSTGGTFLIVAIEREL